MIDNNASTGKNADKISSAYEDLILKINNNSNLPELFQL